MRLSEAAPTQGTVHETSWVSPKAQLGDGVTVGPFAIIHEGVELGDGAFVGSHVVLGEPTGDFYHTSSYNPPTCQIGRGAVIRSHSVVYAGATIGDGFECGHHVSVREGSVIANDVRIGTLSDLQGDLSVGNHVRLHSGVFIPQRTTIEDFVWIFPHAVLLNDPHPPSDTCTQGPTVRRFAVISARATIMPAVEIGEAALVGAMALVRDNVPADAVVIGAPARIVGTTADVVCHDERLAQVYPWWTHFRRGYPEGVLPPVEEGLNRQRRSARDSSE
jgi:acetyltransferase-like isoleucine patch superfamily enzyme